MSTSMIENGNDLAAAVKAREVKTDATMYPDGGFRNKAIEINPDVAGLVCDSYSYKPEKLTITGRRIWAYAGVGNCYEMLNADGTVGSAWTMCGSRRDSRRGRLNI